MYKLYSITWSGTNIDRKFGLGDSGMTLWFNLTLTVSAGIYCTQSCTLYSKPAMQSRKLTKPEVYEYVAHD